MKDQELKGFAPKLYAEIVGIGNIVEDDNEKALSQPVNGSCGGSCSPSSYTTIEPTLRCYSGATPEQNVNGMYSFVPCKRYEDGTTGFERLKIHMQDLSKFNQNGRELITNNLNAAPKITEIEDTKAVEIWNRIRNIVKEQRLLEGVSFVCPTPAEICVIRAHPIPPAGLRPATIPPHKFAVWGDSVGLRPTEWCKWTKGEIGGEGRQTAPLPLTIDCVAHPSVASTAQQRNPI